MADGERIVRAAGPADVTAVVALRQEMFRAMGTPGVEDPGWQRAATDWVRTHLNDPAVRLTVVEVAGEVVSAVIAIRRSAPPSPFLPGGDDVLIANVCTRPEARGHGHARAALDDALAWADRSGAGRIELLATEDGADLYTAAGFMTTPYPVMRRLIGAPPTASDASDPPGR